MGLLKKEKNLGRNPRVEYKKQQSYHYSSRRSLNDKGFDRRSVSLEDNSSVTERKSLLQKLPSLIAIALIIFGIFYLLTVSTTPVIVLQNDNARTQLIDKDQLKTKTKDLLNASLLNQFKLTFNESKIEEEMMSLSPEVTSAKASVNLLRHNSRIIVTFSEPSVLLAGNSRLFVVGSDGRALADVTTDKQGFSVDTLPLVQDESGINIDIGKIALTTEQVDFIRELDYQASSAKLDIVSMAIKPGGFELDVKYASVNYLVKYNFFEDARMSSGVFFATKEKLAQDGTTPIEYIDVRVPERAYVK